MSTGKKAKGGAAQSTASKAKAGGKAASRKTNSKTKQATAKTTDTEVVRPTHDQIALRAQHIWRQKGCLWGQEDENWLEAETQLLAELNGKKK